MDDSDYYDSDDYDYDGMSEDDGILESPGPSAAQHAYVMLDKVGLQAVKEEAIERVKNVLYVTRDQAVRVLRHYQWDPSRASERWFTEQEELEKQLGLVAGEQMTRGQASGTCSICFDGVDAPSLLGPACGHLFCKDCWRGFVEAKFSEGGAAVLDMRCPSPKCGCQVLPQVYRGLVDAALLERYERFETQDMVEQARNLFHCPAVGCDRVARAKGPGAGGKAMDVACECGCSFCGKCQLVYQAHAEPHRPAFCEDVREWTAKASSESSNVEWILINTKSCPKCHKAIEKNSGCMHMTCSQCRHEFCWLCLGDWQRHSEQTGGFYACNRYETARNNGEYSEVDRRKAEAKESHDRYMHYWERYNFYDKAQADATKEQGILRERNLTAIADLTATPLPQLEFLPEAWDTVRESCRTLKWSYCYGYYQLCQDKLSANETLKDLFEFKQRDAELSLDRLRKCLKDRVLELLDRSEKSEELALKHDEINEEFSRLRNDTTDMVKMTARFFREMITELEGDFCHLEQAFAPAAPLGGPGVPGGGFQEPGAEGEGAGASGEGPPKGRKRRTCAPPGPAVGAPDDEGEDMAGASGTPGAEGALMEDQLAIAAAAASGWQCDACTYMNEGDALAACEMCGTDR